MNEFKVCSKCFSKFDLIIKSLAEGISKKMVSLKKYKKNIYSNFDHNLHSENLLNNLNVVLNGFLNKISDLIKKKKFTQIQNYINSIIGGKDEKIKLKKK